MDEREFDGAESAVRTTLSGRAALSPLPPDFARQVALALPERAPRAERSDLRPALAAAIALTLVALAALVFARGSLPPGLSPTPLPSSTQHAAAATSSPQPSPTAEPPSPAPTRVPWTPKPPAPTMLPEGVEPDELIDDAELDPIAKSVAERLFRAYATGGEDLRELFTPLGLQSAIGSDPLIAGIADGERSVLAEPRLVGRWERGTTRYMPDGTPVRVTVELIIDLARGLKVTSGIDETLVETTERQRVGILLTVVLDGARNEWIIDELLSPALGVTLDVPSATPKTAVPCPWRADEIAPANGFDPDVNRAWCDGLGRLVLRRHVSLTRRAPAHCGWESAALLHMGPHPGWEIDPWDHHQYARDPEGVFEAAWLAEYERLPELPASSVDTGLTNGQIRLYYVPETYDREIFAVMGEVIERWPRLREPAGCA